jgi:hypothetical protein
MVSINETRRSNSGRWVTVIIWVSGIVLLFTKPWLVTQFSLNTDSYMFTFLGPLWAFFLVCLLAVFLRIFRKIAEQWSTNRRVFFSVVAALILMLPQADLIMLFRESGRLLHYIDPFRYILLWVTPLTFYLIPSAIVVWGWITHNRLVSTMRALGLALVFIGLVFIPFGIWLTRQAVNFMQP